MHENINDAIILLNKSGHLLKMNKVAEKLTGFTQRELKNTNLSKIYTQQDRNRILKAVKRCLNQGFILVNDTVLKRKNGEEVDIDATIGLVDCQEQQAIQIILRDVSDREKTAQALKKSEERYRQLFENSPIGIYRTTPDGDIVIANPSIIKMLGYSSLQELSKRNLEKDGFHPKYPRTDFKKNIERDGEIKGLESAWIRKDGTVLYARESARAIKDDKGEILYYEGTVEDITERKKMEEILRKTELEKETILDSLVEHVIYEDNNLKIIWPNQAACNSAELKREELIGKYCYKIWGNRKAPCINCPVEKALQTGKPQEFERITPDGRSWFIRGYPVRDDLGQIIGAVEVTLEITQQKHAEKALKAKVNQLNALFKASRAVTTTLDLNCVLAEMILLARKVVSADYTGVLLMDAEENIIQSVEDLKGIPKLEHRVRNEGLTNWIKHRQKAVIVDMIEKDGTIKPPLGKGAPKSANPFIVDAHVKSIAGLPMKVKDKLVGILYFYNCKAYAFKGQLPLLNSFVNQIAIAIDNARLYETAQQELIERKRAEDRITADLREKEVLLKEIHHRVKNNLQVISSLLRLQARYIKDKHSLNIFIESQNRVRSMALVHEKLYGSTDLARIDFAEYVKSLSQTLYDSFKGDQEGIVLHVKADNISLNIDQAVPCGLIINELISNALKYAFVGFKGSKKKIEVQLKPVENDVVELSVKDNGVGISRDINLKETKSLGLHLVTILVKDQLKGELQLIRRSGTKFQIKFKRIVVKD